jgi:predicted outer membrane lipoprotein
MQSWAVGTVLAAAFGVFQHPVRLWRRHLVITAYDPVRAIYGNDGGIGLLHILVFRCQWDRDT